MAKDWPKTGHRSDEESSSFTMFFAELRRVMRHLYDPDVLRKSLLTKVLPIDQNNAIASLQNQLKNSIEALKPGTSISMQSTAWRIYKILQLRYLQQFQQDEVARSLGLSLRQTRRLDGNALRALAEHLWVQHDLSSAMERLQREEIQLKHSESAGVEDTVLPTSENNELEWLEQSQIKETVALPDLIQSLLMTVEIMANKANARLQLELGASLPAVMASVALLRQGILVLLTWLLRLIPNGTLQIELFSQGDQAGIHIIPFPAKGYEPSPIMESSEEMVFARRLIDLSGGRMELTNFLPSRARLANKITLSFPTGKQMMVLIVDDNEDTLRLYQRYLSGSMYTFYSLKDPEQVIAQVQSLTPQVIILDVMLPGIDGWELLSRLREHPHTQKTPVIVSTILPQEPLAMALGAAGFIRKPFSQQDLLRKLNSLFDQSPQEFR